MINGMTLILICLDDVVPRCPTYGVYGSLSKKWRNSERQNPKNMKKLKSPIFRVVLNYFINTGMGK